MSILKTLDQPTAKLVQIGLRELGFYQGTTAGKPGPKTDAAYDNYLKAENAPASYRPLALHLADIAIGEIGVREDPQDSNRGARVEEYQRATWLDGSGWPYCAAFICWVIMKAEETHILPFQRPRTPGAWDFINWAEGQNLLSFDPRDNFDEILAGDIIVYTFSHIGMCVVPSTSNMIETVEGNTDVNGSRDGGGVYRKMRKRDQIRRVIRLTEL